MKRKISERNYSEPTLDLTGGNDIRISDVVNKPRGGTTDGCQQDMALK